ncbi:MAG: thiol:disulfide interchange protein DsbA/DsbL [Lysobacteraceae bacterium]|nr:MAG: thiol:disulfide interchange protein DsbA/DsbL [Xanthomonadaceae bacterium]
MKCPSKLIALALVALLSACSPKNEAAVPAATDPVATAPVEAATVTEPAPPAAAEATPASDAAPTAPVAATAPSGPEPVAGTDYIQIDNGQPFAPLAGKIEVAEVFGYTCPHCAQFEPLINTWKRKQPADVQVTAVPAAFGGYWITYARAFYAAETLGVLAKSHDAMFNALHVKRSLDPNATPEKIAGFYAQYGVDPKTFVATMSSFGVETKLNRAKQFAMRSKVEGTPSIVVGGKYLVSIDQRGYDVMFNTVEHLVARERAARGGAN